MLKKPLRGFAPKSTHEKIIALDVTSKCNYNNYMEFEWDNIKRKLNIKKHGIDFVDAPSVFDGYTFTIIDDRIDYAKERFVTFGILEGASRCGCSY